MSVVLMHEEDVDIFGKVKEKVADLYQAEFEFLILSQKKKALDKMARNPPGEKDGKPKVHYEELIERVGAFSGLYNSWTKNVLS